MLQVACGRVSPDLLCSGFCARWLYLRTASSGFLLRIVYSVTAARISNGAAITARKIWSCAMQQLKLSMRPGRQHASHIVNWHLPAHLGMLCRSRCPAAPLWKQTGTGGIRQRLAGCQQDSCSEAVVPTSNCCTRGTALLGVVWSTGDSVELSIQCEATAQRCVCSA